MVPIRLEIRDFLSYKGTHVLDFSGVHVASIIGPNGAGKSAILDAMTFSLFGKARKPTTVGRVTKADREKIINDYADSCEVSLEFQVEGNRFLVDRAMDRGGSVRLQFKQLTTDGENDLRGKKTEETDRIIEDELGFSYDVFASSSFITQGDSSHFMDARPEERRDILAQILELGKYENCKEIAQEKLKEMKKQLSVAGERLLEKIELGNKLQEFEGKLAESESAFLENDRFWRASKEELETQKKELGRLHSEITSLKEKKQRLDRLGQQKGETEKDLANIKTELAKQQSIIDRQDDIERGFFELKNARQKVDQLNNLAQESASLQREIDLLNATISNKRTELETDLKGLHQRLDEATKAKQGLPKFEEGLEEALRNKRRFDEAQKQNLSFEAELGSLQNSYATDKEAFEKAKTRLDQILSKLAVSNPSEIQDEIDQTKRIEQKTSDLQSQIIQIRESLDSIVAQKANISSEIAHLEEEINLLQTGEGGLCPLCGQAMPEGGAEKLLLDKDAKKDALSKKLGLSTDNEKEQRALLKTLENELAAARLKLARLPLFAQALSQNNDFISASESLESSTHVLAGKKEELEKFKQENPLLGLASEIEQALVTAKTVLEGAKKMASSFDGLSEEVGSISKTLETEDYAVAEKRKTKELKEKFTGLAFDTGKLVDAKNKLDKLSHFEQDKNQLDQARAGFEAKSHQKYDKEKQLENINQEMASLWEQVSKFPGLESEVSILNEKTKAAQEKEQELLRQRDEALRRKEASSNDVALAKKALEESTLLQKNISELDFQKKVLDICVSMFSLEGIPSNILQGIIPQLQEMANTILQRISQGHPGSESMKMEFRLERAGPKDKSYSTLDIILSDGEISRPYELFSGGERFRADFAIRVALSKLLAERAGSRLRTLVIDEGFGTQDTEGISRLVESINEVASDFDKVLVVSHVEEIKNSFERRIIVSRDENGSHFELV